MSSACDRSRIELKEGLHLVFPAGHPIDVRALYVFCAWASANLGGKWAFCAGFLPGTSLAVQTSRPLNDDLDVPFAE